jgi:Skp family chaperone for outer membrane proteins
MNKLFLILITFFITNSVIASEKVFDNIAVVNFQVIVKDSLVFKDLQAQIEKKTSEFQSEASKKEKELAKQNQELAKQRTVLSEEALAKKAREYENKVGEFYRNTQNKEMNYNRAFSEAENEIHKKISEIVSKIAEERGLIIVMPSNNLLYYKEYLDITAEVLKRLNQQLTKINIKY